MENKDYENPCIACTVTICKNHSDDSNYCSLKKITVGTHKPRRAEPVCTDCKSFQLRSDLL